MTDVAGFQIRRYVGGTSTVLSQSGIEHAESTAVGARALGLHKVHVVLGASEEPVVAADTPAESHPSVERRLHNDDVVVGTSSAERVGLAELLNTPCVCDTYTQ